MFIDLPTAKLHLRVDSTEEDALIELWLAAAEQGAADYLNRHIYVDQAALTAAIANVPADLAAATAAYDAAILAADAIDTVVDADMARFAALEAYNAAQSDARRTHQGVVANANIKAAALLTLGHLYANREDVIVGVSVTALPMGAQSLLQPYRVGLGV